MDKVIHEQIDLILENIFKNKKIMIVAMGIPAFQQRLLNYIKKFSIQDYLMIVSQSCIDMFGGEVNEKMLCIKADRLPENTTDALEIHLNSLENLDQEALKAIDEFDPEKEAVVLDTLCLTENNFLGRKLYGNRSPESLALENKHLDFKIFKELSLPSVDQKVVKIADLEWNLCKEIDLGYGCVLVTERKKKFPGGSLSQIVIKNEEDLIGVKHSLEGRNEDIKIMPYLCGKACSIHGFITPQETYNFSPNETIALYSPKSKQFKYCGVSTHFTPTEEEYESMKTVFHKVSKYLRENYGLLGGNHIDGILVDGEFYAIDLNPRLGGGSSAISALAEPENPNLFLVDLAIKNCPPYMKMDFSDFMQFYNELMKKKGRCRVNFEVLHTIKPKTFTLKKNGVHLAEIGISKSTSGTAISVNLNLDIVDESKGCASYVTEIINNVLDDESLHEDKLTPWTALV